MAYLKKKTKKLQDATCGEKTKKPTKNTKDTKAYLKGPQTEQWQLLLKITACKH